MILPVIPNIVLYMTYALTYPKKHHAKAPMGVKHPPRSQATQKTDMNVCFFRCVPSMRNNMAVKVRYTLGSREC